MQSTDPIGELVQSSPVDLDNASDILNKIKEAREKGAVTHTIGELPMKDQTAVVNGLTYKIIFADYVRGKYTIKMELM